MRLGLLIVRGNPCDPWLDQRWMKTLVTGMGGFFFKAISTHPFAAGGIAAVGSRACVRRQIPNFHRGICRRAVSPAPAGTLEVLIAEPPA
jgi:hypothetical protein